MVFTTYKSGDDWGMVYGIVSTTFYVGVMLSLKMDIRMVIKPINWDILPVTIVVDPRMTGTEFPRT